MTGRPCAVDDGQLGDERRVEQRGDRCRDGGHGGAPERREWRGLHSAAHRSTFCYAPTWQVSRRARRRTVARYHAHPCPTPSCRRRVSAPDTPATASLIHARGLTKRFGEFTAVDAIDFDVAPGESFGFLGPNGAGKTSTMRMIGCVSPITRRHAADPGHGPGRRRSADPRAARRRAPAGHARHRADRPREPASSTAATSA